MQELDALIAEERGRTGGARPDVLARLYAAKNEARRERLLVAQEQIPMLPIPASGEEADRRLRRNAWRTRAAAELRAKLRAAGKMPPEVLSPGSRRDFATIEESVVRNALTPAHIADCEADAAKEEDRRAEKILQLTQESGVQRANWDLDLRTLIESPPPWLPRGPVGLAQWLLTLFANPRTACVFGASGRGKTTTAQAAVITVVRRRQRGCYRPTLDYLFGLTSLGIGARGEYRERFRTAPFMVLDCIEHASSKLVAWTTDELADLIQTRERAGLPTLLLSDLPTADDVHAHLPECLKPRMQNTSGAEYRDANWEPLLPLKEAWEARQREQKQQARRAAAG